MARSTSPTAHVNQTPDNVAVSIYAVSRTHGKPLHKWGSLLKQIEEEAPFRGQSYAPFRACIIALLQGHASPEDLLNDGFGAMLDNANARWQQRIVNSMWKRSARAFERFSQELVGRFGSVQKVYEQPRFTNYVDFEGVPIKGRFHFAADFDDTHSYVYLIGGDWDDLQTLAFSELLTVVAEEAHDATRDDVLLIDLSLDNPIVRPKANAKRLRKALLEEAKNLRRLIRAISQE